MKDSDVAPVQVEEKATTKEIEKLQFPQIEADMSPAAVIPKACASLQKYVSKLDALVGQFRSGINLTELQKRRLVMTVLGMLVFFSTRMPTNYCKTRWVSLKRKTPSKAVQQSDASWVILNIHGVALFLSACSQCNDQELSFGDLPRMQAKLEEAMNSISAHDEKLIEFHGLGIVDGYTHELLRMT